MSVYPKKTTEYKTVEIPDLGGKKFRLAVDTYDDGSHYISGYSVKEEPKPYPFTPGTEWIDKYGDLWEVGGSCDLYRKHWNKGYSGMPVKDVQNILGPLTQVVTPTISYGAAQVIAPPEPKRWKDAQGQVWVETLGHADILREPHSTATWSRGLVERNWGKLKEYARRDSLKPGDVAISSHYGQRTVRSATQYGTEGQTTEIAWAASPSYYNAIIERYDSSLLIEVVSRAEEPF